MKSDTIYREAAVKHLKHRLYETATNNPDIAGVFSEIADNRVETWIEELPSAQQRWIPVTERLPEEYTRVIGYMAWRAMTAIEYQHGRWYSIDHLEPLPDEAVSHWMPLPQPPKEGDE